MASLQSDDSRGDMNRSDDEDESTDHSSTSPPVYKLSFDPLTSSKASGDSKNMHKFADTTTVAGAIMSNSLGVVKMFVLRDFNVDEPFIIEHITKWKDYSNIPPDGDSLFSSVAGSARIPLVWLAIRNVYENYHFPIDPLHKSLRNFIAPYDPNSSTQRTKDAMEILMIILSFNPCLTTRVTCFILNADIGREIFTSNSGCQSFEGCALQFIHLLIQKASMHTKNSGSMGGFEAYLREVESLILEATNRISSSCQASPATAKSSSEVPSAILSKLFLHPWHSDVQFKCSDQPAACKLIFAHKNVLAAASECFKTMFESSIFSGSKSTIETTRSYDDMRTLMKYIYTGHLDLATSSPFDMLKIAEQYEMASLLASCELCCIQRLSLNNVLHCLEVAFTFNSTDSTNMKCKRLLKACFDFLNCNANSLIGRETFNAWQEDKKVNNLPLWNIFLSSVGGKSVEVNQVAGSDPKKRPKAGGGEMSVAKKSSNG